ncbi:hypothetical protein [Spartinivicinus poritis]|uniref:Lipoprotein n=1 Tax=Spartinivicinus poritis TaxID=2994640 RepID=A0ABT5UI33_9GAMM|nr:hypothetical protein [Spartinivicinus sp. A2-2]MDE1465870.1 hypothetical protein [Spartinivicinus sp. A2-2]
MLKLLKHKIYALLVAMTLLAGCQQKVYVSIVKIDKNNNPTFCVSTWPNCVGAGVSLSDFFIAELDDKGKWSTKDGITNLLWWLEPAESYPSLKEVTYGVVPSGWKEEAPAKPLQLNKWYTISGYYYLHVRKKGFELLSHAEYYNRLPDHE